MKTGMLWYSGSKTKTFTQKVNEALEYYYKKYGRTPEMCVVNHKNLPAENEREIKFHGFTIPVTSEQYILEDCFFLCVEIANPEDQPKPTPVVRSAADPADAFIRHAQKVSA